MPDRQRSIEATFNYSWTLLEQAEQDAFMKLSVFRGGFTADAAQMVAGADLRLLRRLVSKALLQALPDDRFDTHDLLRKFGADKLHEAGEPDIVAQRYVRYYAELVQALVPDLKGRRQFDGLNEFEADMQNIRRTWVLATRQGDIASGDQMVEGLRIYHIMRTRYREGEEMFRHGLAALMPETSERQTFLRGRIQSALAAILAQTGYEGYVEAQTYLEDSLAIAQDAGDRAEIAFCQLKLSHARWRKAYLDDVPEPEIGPLEDSLLYFQRAGDEHYVGSALSALINRYRHFTKLAKDPVRIEKLRNKTLALIEQYLALTNRIGDLVGAAHAHRLASFYALEKRDLRQSEQHLLEAQQICRRVRTPRHLAKSTVDLAANAFFRGDMERFQALADEGWNLTADLNIAYFKCDARAYLGLAACMQEDYAVGYELCLESLTYETQVFNKEAVSFFGLSIATIGQGDFEATESHMVKVLVSYCAPRDQLRLPSLPALAAPLVAYRGQLHQAAELLGLVAAQSQDNIGWVACWPVIDRLQDQLKADLGADSFQRAFEHGKTRDLEMVVDGLLAEFSP